ncbi:MAG: DUF4482 domain-containing protein [Bacteroidales bacterium]|nr:DUF4482 domain-containing protein [Bacteroidales bacterium]
MVQSKGPIAVRTTLSIIETYAQMREMARTMEQLQDVDDERLRILCCIKTLNHHDVPSVSSGCGPVGSLRLPAADSSHRCAPLAVPPLSSAGA